MDGSATLIRSRNGPFPNGQYIIPQWGWKDRHFNELGLQSAQACPAVSFNRWLDIRTLF